MTRPHPDPVAAASTVIAGLAGIGQLFLSWTSIVPGVDLPAPHGGLTGWDLFRADKAGASLSAKVGIDVYSIVGVAAIGVALTLLGIAMLAPIDHRPLGSTGLLLSLAALAAAAWWLVTAQTILDQPFSQVFARAGLGWYLFLTTGLFGLVGTSKALVSR